MKNKNSEYKIMKYLDGGTNEITNEEILSEVKQIKEILADFNELPLLEVDKKTDYRFYKFTEDIKLCVTSQSKSNDFNNYKIWLPYSIAAACLTILFFIMMNSKNLQEEYGSLNTNTDKLSFIYDLNKEDLSLSDVEWLNQVLSIEKNPNIKITIIDVLDNYIRELNTDFIEQLNDEYIPSVQLAMLNIIEDLDNSYKSNSLLAFTNRNDLDAIILKKAKDILSNRK